MGCQHRWEVRYDPEAKERHDRCSRCGVAIRFYSVWTSAGDLKLRGDVTPDFLADAAVVKRAKAGVRSASMAIAGESREPRLTRLHPERRRGRRGALA